MRQMKDVFRTVLDVRVPPTPTREDMLFVVRAARRRRRTRRVAAAMSAAATVTAVVLAGPRWLARQPATGTQLVGAVEEPSRSVPQADAPTAVTPQRHGDSMAETLSAIIPTRFDGDGNFITDEGGKRHLARRTIDLPTRQADGVFRVTADLHLGEKRASAMVVVRRTGRPEPFGDLCSSENLIVFRGTDQPSGAETACTVLTASNGDRVRFGSIDSGNIEYAVRFRAGGYVMVRQSAIPGRQYFAVWTKQQLADAASTAAFWPTGLTTGPR